MIKHPFLIFSLMLLPLSAFAQNAQQNARIKAIRELSTTTHSVMKDMAENTQNNAFFRAEAAVNEAAVGIVNYKYEYYPASIFSGQQAGDFARMKRTVTVFPADVTEVLYDASGRPVFYFETMRSYQDEGCHLDTRIYWNEDGTLCYVSRERVSDNKSKTPHEISGEEVQAALDLAYSLRAKCSSFIEASDECLDDSEMGDDYTGHSLNMWNEYRHKLVSLLPKADGRTQKVTEYAFLDIDGDATLECIVHTDCYQTAVFTHGNADGIATDDISLVACFNTTGVHLIPEGHAVVTYEGVSIGYERENIYVIDRSKVANVYSYSADPQGGGSVKFAYKRLDKATGKVTPLREDAYEALKKQIGDNWRSEADLEWHRY